MNEHWLQEISVKTGNRHSLLAYADWLEQQGDRRGELIRIELKLASMPVDSLQHTILRSVACALRQELSVQTNWLSTIGLLKSMRLDDLLANRSDHLGSVYTASGLLVFQENPTTRKMGCWLVKQAEFAIHPSDSTHRNFLHQLWGPVSGRRFEDIILDKRQAVLIQSDEVTKNAVNLYGLVGGSAIDFFELGTVTGRLLPSPNAEYVACIDDVTCVDVYGFNLCETEVDFQKYDVNVVDANLTTWFGK